MTLIAQRQLFERVTNRLSEVEQVTATAADLAKETDKLLKDVRKFKAAMALMEDRPKHQ